MMWLAILIAAVTVIIFSVICYFFRMAFVRKKDKNQIDGAPKIEQYGEYYKTVKEGREWLDSRHTDDAFVKSYDGLSLHARVIKADCQVDKTIILFHGYRSAAVRDFSCAIPYYHSLGMNVVLVDQRSHGKSEGRLITFGVKERFDVCTWVEWAKKTFPDTKIYLSGLSMGASTVMMASDIVDGVSGIIADCGFTSPKAIIQIVAKKHFKLPKWCCAPVGLMARIFGGFNYSYSTTQALAKTNIPVLFIHGASDDFVPCYMTDESYAACASEKEKVIVEGAIHGFSFLVDPDRVKNALENFILKNEE